MGANESHTECNWDLPTDSSEGSWLESDVSCDGSYSSDEADNPCCTPNEVASNVGHISQLTSFMRGLFVTKEIQDAMRAVCRSHFVYNTGAEIRSVYYNTTASNGQHVCFAPRREVNIDTVIAQFLENLQLQPGYHFLNLGSGTGYLSTLAGLIIGPSGINHGMEVNPQMLAYAEERQKALRDHIDSLQDFDYCEPHFVLGDALKIGTVDCILRHYDSIFCSCIPPSGYENILKLHLKEGGRLLFPQSGGMCVVIEKRGAEFVRREVDVFSSVYTYPLVAGHSQQTTELLDNNFPSLQQLSRSVIRSQLRKALCAHVMRKRKSDDEQERSPSSSRQKKRKNSSASETVDNVSVSENNSCHEIDFRTIQNYDFRTRTAHSSTVTELNSVMANSRVGSVDHDENTQDDQLDVSRVESIDHEEIVPPPSQNMLSGILGEEEQVAVDPLPDAGIIAMDPLPDPDVVAMDPFPVNNNVPVDPIPSPEIERQNPEEENIVDLEQADNESVDHEEVIPGLVYSLNRQFGIAAGEESSDNNSSDRWDEDSVHSGYSNSTEPFDDAMNELMFLPEQQFCNQCHMIKGKSVPRKVVAYEPDRSFPPHCLNARISELPLPDNILLYLKYKHDLMEVEVPS